MRTEEGCVRAWVRVAFGRTWHSRAVGVAPWGGRDARVRTRGALEATRAPGNHGIRVPARTPSFCERPGSSSPQLELERREKEAAQRSTKLIDESLAVEKKLVEATR
jgi:hypothetical protein